MMASQFISRSTARALVALAFLSSLPACDCGGANLGQATDGVTLVEPAGPADSAERTVDFGTVRVGKLAKQRLLFRNDGRSSARITSASLVTQSPDLYLGGTNPLPTLESGNTWEIELRYLPSDVGDDVGEVIVETDSVNTPRYVVRVSGKGARSRVDVCAPAAGGGENCFSTLPAGGELVVDLGGVSAGDSKRATITVKNAGDAVATVSHVLPTDATSPDFTTEPKNVPTLQQDGSFTLATQAQATYDVVFTAAYGGNVEGYVEVLSDDPEHSSILVKVVASVDAPRLCIDPINVEFPDPGIGRTATRQVKFTSCGTKPLTIYVVQLYDDTKVFGFSSPAELPCDTNGGTITRIDCSQAPSAPLVKAPGESLIVDFTYSPKARQADLGYVNFRTDGGNGQLKLRGQGDGCVLEAAPSPVSFGQVPSGTRASKNVQLRNTGQKDCELSAASIKENPTPFGIERAPTFPLTLAAGQATTVSVYFEPTSQNRESATLQVATSAGGGIDVALTGSGTAALKCGLKAVPSSVVFAGISAGQTASVNLDLQNIGTEECDILGSSITGPDASSFRGSVGGCIPPTTVGPGARITVPVTFAPTTSGNKQASLEMIYQQSGSFGLCLPGQTPRGTKLTVALEGGTLAPQLCIEPQPPELDYGTVAAGQTKQLSFTIRSCGQGSLGLRGVTMAPGTTREFSFPTRVQTPQFLTPGQTVTVNVQYAPKTNGADFGSVAVLSNDPANPRSVVKLRANATSPCAKQLACSADTLGFPTTEIRRSSSMTLVCTNVGSQPVTVTGTTLSSTTSAEFRASAGRGSTTTVPPGGTIRMEVSYTPADVGTDLGQASILSDSCTPTTVALNAAGSQRNYPRCLPPQMFQPREKWAWSGGRTETSSKNVSMSPLVLNLTDDNNDGRIDESDVPDVIFTSCKASECCINCMNVSSGSFADSDFSGKGILRAVSGRDGSELWTVTDPALRLTAMTQLAAGDLDGDNVPEIVAVKYHFQKGSGSSGMEGKYKNGALLVFDNNGQLKFETEQWSGDDKAGEQAGAPTIGDLDGDGAAEILFEKTVFANDGRKLYDLPTSGNFGHGAFVSVVDLDNDGTGEILQGKTTYTNTGTRKWQASTNNGSFAVVDVEADGRAEVVVREDSFKFVVLDAATGAKKYGPFTWTGPVDSQGQAESVCPSAFAAADVDGDRKPDIIIPSGDYIHVFNAVTGREIWKASIDDYSRSCGASGAAAFDFEGDGRFEVVYHDSDHMYVFRGQDGTKLYDSPRNSSTIWETPVIADVDNDGHADIIMTNENGILGIGGGAGVKVLSNDTNNWPATRRIWNEHAYHQTSVRENGSVPRVEIPNWTNAETNNWRANPTLCTP